MSDVCAQGSELKLIEGNESSLTLGDCTLSTHEHPDDGQVDEGNKELIHFSTENQLQLPRQCLEQSSELTNGGQPVSTSEVSHTSEDNPQLSHRNWPSIDPEELLNSATDICREQTNTELTDASGRVWEPAEHDILSGRGANVNSHPGNRKFRAICFSRKALFEAANHAAKRRITTEIVTMAFSTGARFLRKRENKGPWFPMTTEQAILKSAQVMRDYKRPDRLIRTEMAAASGTQRRRRASATPLLDEIAVPPAPSAPIVENPDGVHDSDVLCGRGAFVNGHSGNQRLRKLGMSRKAQFDAGSYSEKRILAVEMVKIIADLEPPGRFLRKCTASGEWEELDADKSVHKACQVMRDIDRQDRKVREERRRLRQLRKQGVELPDIYTTEITAQDVTAMTLSGNTTSMIEFDESTLKECDRAVALDDDAHVDMGVGEQDTAFKQRNNPLCVSDATDEAKLNF